MRQKLITHNKRGKIGPGLLVVFIVLGLLAAGGIIWGVSQTMKPGVEDVEEELEITGDCETSPVITVSGLDKINPGTTVAIAEQARVNDQFIGSITSGTTPFRYGDSVELQLGVANYLNITDGPFTVTCGENRRVVNLYATDDGTFKVFNDDGNAVTDLVSGGATNQSSSSTAIIMEVKITPSSDQSVGDLVIVIDAANTTEVDNIVFSGPGVTTTDVPSFFTVQATGSIVKAFDVTGIDTLIDGKAEYYTLLFEPESGWEIGADDSGDGGGMTVLMTAYSKQWFVDIDGTFQYGIEDADGGTEYEDDWDYDWCVGTGEGCA